MPVPVGNYLVQQGISGWNRYTTFRDLGTQQKDGFLTEQVDNCPSMKNSFKIKLGANHGLTGYNEGDLVASVDLKLSMYTRMTVSDCNGDFLYYITQENMQWFSYQVALRVCLDENCDDVIGISEKSGYYDKEIILRAVDEDNKISNDFEARAAKQYEYIDTKPIYDVYAPVYVQGETPQIGDPLIMVAIVTNQLFLDSENSGVCNTMFWLGIIAGVLIVFSVGGYMVKKKRASQENTSSNDYAV